MTDFEPTKHLTKVSGQDYLQVKWRIMWFRSVHPDGSITTEMIQHQNSTAVFKASVSWPTDSGIVVCSDYGSEAVDDFGDYLEKASTKAIGRALALAGFGTQFAGDDETGLVADSPVGYGQQAGYAPRAGAGSGGNRQEATPRQIKYLHAVAAERGISHEELHDRCMESFNCSVADLSRRDVSTMIEQIQAERVLPGLPG